MKQVGSTSMGYGQHVWHQASGAARYSERATRAGLAALSLAACNEPPRATANVDIMLGTPVSRAAKFTAGFSLLTGCGAQQTLELNTSGVLEQARLRIHIDGEGAALLEMGTNSPALGTEPFNGWYNTSNGTVKRQKLSENWVHLTIDVEGHAGGGTWQPQGGRMPRTRVHVDGRFKQIAGYGFGGQTPCPMEVE